MGRYRETREAVLWCERQIGKAGIKRRVFPYGESKVALHDNRLREFKKKQCVGIHSDQIRFVMTKL